MCQDVTHSVEKFPTLSGSGDSGKARLSTGGLPPTEAPSRSADAPGSGPGTGGTSGGPAGSSPRSGDRSTEASSYITSARGTPPGFMLGATDRTCTGSRRATVGDAPRTPRPPYPTWGVRAAGVTPASLSCRPKILRLNVARGCGREERALRVLSCRPNPSVPPPGQKPPPGLPHPEPRDQKGLHPRHRQELEVEDRPVIAHRQGGPVQPDHPAPRAVRLGIHKKSVSVRDRVERKLWAA
jgi:hypothetical protein